MVLFLAGCLSKVIWLDHQINWIIQLEERMFFIVHSALFGCARACVCVCLESYYLAYYFVWTLLRAKSISVYQRNWQREYQQPKTSLGPEESVLVVNETWTVSQCVCFNEQAEKLWDFKKQKPGIRLTWIFFVTVCMMHAGKRGIHCGCYGISFNKVQWNGNT